jgi:uncharacterized membrane-anchored protein
MKKHTLWWFFSALQLLSVGWMIYRYQQVRNEGVLYRFLLEPIDPADPFRGRYLQLSFEADRVKVCNYVNDDFSDDLYVSLGTDSLGFAKPISAGWNKPASGDYLISKNPDFYDDENNCAQAILRYNFDRWYMNETLAPLAETKLTKALTREGTRCWLNVRIREGKAVAEELYVNDTALADWMKQ